ncbi:unnamed protein product [Arctia plantaginis]|uniref:Harmonin-binding protein USHBP1 PDZ-binding domain-containing protein n=1 Tax=Arctia plantaginis TaxID=874455 RepID=A0A8S1AHR5_ARCPL|nr:unnamed protein product [Arctia plantaginis]
MKIQTLAGTRTLSGEPPRSTAYYYADLERLKRKNGQEPIQEVIVQNPDELSEYVDTNEVINDGAVREVPPLRDRVRHWSLPDYNTPENSRKIEETYSTAGTFPMPEPKEKEPLLAELEVVGRLPLTQLDSASGVRRSRSWYLCCPNVAEEEISRESSWRYSSLRPVTAPPIAGQNGFHMMVATQSSGPDDLASLRAERDGLARALAAERQRAATAARAHDARLAELHGVIAELVRRRAHDKHARAIPEEEVSDECESTTQPAGELDNDADRSRTEQNDTLSALSPAELPTPHESKVEPEPDDTTDTSTHLASRSECAPDVEERAAPPADLPTDAEATDACDTSLNLSERDSDPGRGSARCCDGGGDTSAGGSCERERGSPDEHRLYTHSAGRCESRQAKLASRVRLRKTEDDDSNRPPSDDGWCAEAAERLALDVCAHADLREALLAAQHHEGGGGCAGCAGRVARLLAERRVLRCALSRAADTAHRLYCACALHESTSVALCCALRAADRALEAYDVLLALAETCHAPRDPQRSSAELVARQLLARLDAERGAAAIGEPLLSPGPWLQHHAQVGPGAWSRECEARLRAHAARLKADTVALRGNQPPKMFSYHDVEESELVAARAGCSAAEMEAAVALQDALHHTHLHQRPKGSSPRRSRRTRHWLDTRASETDL